MAWLNVRSPWPAGPSTCPDPVAVPETPRARLRHVVVDVHEAVLEADHRRGQLPRRTRRIGALHRLVVERGTRIVEQRVVVRYGDAADESIRIEARRAVEREHGAGSRFDRHDAARERVAEDAARRTPAGRGRCSCTTASPAAVRDPRARRPRGPRVRARPLRRTGCLRDRAASTRTGAPVPASPPAVPACSRRTPASRAPRR